MWQNWELGRWHNLTTLLTWAFMRTYCVLSARTQERCISSNCNTTKNNPKQHSHCVPSAMDYIFEFRILYCGWNRKYFCDYNNLRSFAWTKESLLAWNYTTKPRAHYCKATVGEKGYHRFFINLWMNFFIIIFFFHFSRYHFLCIKTLKVLYISR